MPGESRNRRSIGSPRRCPTPGIRTGVACRAPLRLRLPPSGTRVAPRSARHWSTFRTRRHLHPYPYPPPRPTMSRSRSNGERRASVRCDDGARRGIRGDTAAPPDQQQSLGIRVLGIGLAGRTHAASLRRVTASTAPAGRNPGLRRPRRASHRCPPRARRSAAVQPPGGCGIPSGAAHLAGVGRREPEASVLPRACVRSADR